MLISFILGFKLCYIFSLELAHLSVLWMVVFIHGKLVLSFESLIVLVEKEWKA